VPPERAEPCPGCGAELPIVEGPTHRYIGASPACWAIYTSLTGAGEPPLAPGPLNGLLVDAYAAQHPGTPSDQAIQSVAVHLLTLYGVLVRSAAPDQALWLRRRGLRDGRAPKHSRFRWLAPPSFEGSLNVAAIAAAPTPQPRAGLAGQYVRQVWALWAADHQATVAGWYDQYVVPERI
jgi:hypothetical protein